MKSPEQATVERLRKRLKADPARMNRLRVEFDKVTRLLSGCVTRQWKVYEVHHVVEKARAGMLIAIEAGVPDNVAWIHAMHAAGFPAAPHPRTMK